MNNNITKLTYENADQAWKVSDGLRARVYEEALEFTAYYQADEILSYFRHYTEGRGRYETLANYEIDNCRAWVKPDYNKLTDFFGDCLKVAEVFGVFSEDEKNKLRRVYEKVSDYEDFAIGRGNISVKKFNMLEKWIMQAAEDAAAVIAEEAQSAYTQFDDASILYDYFITCWLDGNEDLTFDGVNVYETITRKL